MSTRLLLAAAALLLSSVAGSAQVLGTFRWQMQPYCNTVILTLTATPTGFTLDGADDQCGGPNKGSAVGTASFNASGNLVLNFTIGLPSASPVQVTAFVSPATGDGTWNDSNTLNGPFKFFGATAGLPPRPDLRDVRFRVTVANDLSLPPGMPGVLRWATLSYNVGGGTYSAGSGAYVLPVDGTYLITAAARISAPTPVNGFYCLSLNVNTVDMHFECRLHTSFGPIPNLTTVRFLNAGSTLTLRAFNGSNTTHTVTGTLNTSEFTVTRLR